MGELVGEHDNGWTSRWTW